MKKVIAFVLTTSLILTLGLASVAYATDGIDAIHATKTTTELEQAMRHTKELTDEIKQFDALNISEQHDVLTDLMVRKNRQTDISAFKAFFAEVYKAATTYIHYAKGYPYITSESKRGAYVVVKTDISGYVYVITMRDGIAGGISDGYDFMKYYKADNDVNKTRVWVQGGVETKIPVPARYGSGWTYRAYLCLKQDGNISGFTEVKYTADQLYYHYNVVARDGSATTIWYDVYLTANDPCSYEGQHYIGPTLFLWATRYNTYPTAGEKQVIDTEYTTRLENLNIIETKLTFADGITYYDTLLLPGTGELENKR